LTGEIPAALNAVPALQILWLNNQRGDGLTGKIEVVASMISLTSLWLHGNKFSGSIPMNIGDLVSLRDLDLNGNEFVGLIPRGLSGMKLERLDLNNNHFMGPIPDFAADKVSFESNNFCLSKPGAMCAFEVMALLDFLGGLGYPQILVDSWSGNNPCDGPWLGIKCNGDGKVEMIILNNFNLSGTLSPSIAKLDSLVGIRLGGNDISGRIPSNWTSLRSLTLLDLSGNNISLPLPSFAKGVKLVIDGNPQLHGAPAPGSVSGSSPGSGSGEVEPPSSDKHNPNPSKDTGPNPKSGSVSPESNNSRRKGLVTIVAPIAGVAAAAFVLIPLSVYCFRKRKGVSEKAGSLVIHPRESSDSNNLLKVVIANDGNGSVSTVTGSGTLNGSADSHVIESGNLVISVQVLRNVTKNFARENELGRGGFGVVYKGELDDGTKIAVKRMESGVITSKALDEFQSEIAVLSKVRHRHLVSLLGYSVEGNERILVYEYMPQGALSMHLFHWKSSQLEPLSWKRRLNIALDVARGMEYLHSLAHQIFIHRDLKSSNILLGDDFRAKVSDFGLVKLAPDGKKSVVTRLAGTFGYLAPEYAGNCVLFHFANLL